MTLFHSIHPFIHLSIHASIFLFLTGTPPIMPTVDADGRIVGILLREDRDTGNYSSCYVVINFTSRLLNLYSPEAEVCATLASLYTIVPVLIGLNHLLSLKCVNFPVYS